MTSREALRAGLAANRSVILAAGLAAAAAVIVALAIVLASTPVYRAETQVSIRPRIADLGTAEAAARLVRNYAVWVDSKAYAARLAPEQSAGLNAEQIVRNVRTRGDADRLLVTIQSEDTNPDRAAATVNGLADLLVREVATPERLNDAEKGLEVAVIDPAGVPQAAVWPRPGIVLPVAALIGAFAGGALWWLLRPAPAGAARAGEADG